MLYRSHHPPFAKVASGTARPHLAIKTEAHSLFDTLLEAVPPIIIIQQRYVTGRPDPVLPGQEHYTLQRKKQDFDAY